MPASLRDSSRDLSQYRRVLELVNDDLERLGRLRSMVNGGDLYAGTSELELLVSGLAKRRRLHGSRAGPLPFIMVGFFL